MYDDDSFCLYHIRSQLAQRQQFARSRSENNWAFLPPSPSATVSNRRSRSTIEERGGEMKKKKIRSIPSPLSLSPSPLLARTVQRVTHAEDSVFESWQSGQRVSGYFADFPRNLHCMQAPYEVEEKNSTTARLSAVRGKNKTFCTPIGGDVPRPKSDSPEPRSPHSERGSHARLAADVQTVQGEREREPPPPHSLLLPTGRERERGKGDTQRY